MRPVPFEAPDRLVYITEVHPPPLPRSEVALALVLLIGAGLMASSYARVLAVEAGFNPEDLQTTVWPQLHTHFSLPEVAAPTIIMH